jgi:outer membrane receptor protein involved in Fe transport
MGSSHSARRISVVAILQFAALIAHAQAIEEIVVTASLRERPLDEVAASVSVLDGAQLAAMAVQHFEEIINVVPNLNWSGDGHRARYFQIRGVGELEQYQGAPNPSVGFLIDDIDFSGIGSVATLFDLEQVEVLRGPQGTRYGANALAGLIYLRSASPTPEWNGQLQLVAADDDAVSAGLAVGGPLGAGDELTFRASAHRHESDGFRRNTYLGRDDTNGRDETTMRGRLRWTPSEAWQVDLALLFADIENGYDAFALDNSYDMLSDKPGRDAQRSAGMSLRAEYAGRGGTTITSITAIADSDIVFGFDADWGNPASWAPVIYDYVSLSDRRRGTVSQELRLSRAGWLAGVYALRLEDDLQSVNRGEYFDPFYDFADSLDDVFDSNYSATSLALFGQYEHALGPATRLTAGLRVERRDTDYSDSSGLRAGPSETMAGGELALLHEHSPAVSSYLGLTRGYKAGGFNLGAVPEGRREFMAEALWNLELGVKALLLGERLSVNAAIFANRRNEQQVRTSFQLVPGDPASFVFFTDNAARGRTLGLEADLRFAPTPAWSVYASLGLLDAEFDEFVTPQVDLSGRDQAHAPGWTAALGAAYRHPRGLFARVDLAARDAFYFDVSHDEKSEAYATVNARLGYEWNHWTAQLWVRNAFDEHYAVRGFYFGNEPPDFPDTLYTRLGDPRQVGLTLDRSF